MPSDTTTTIKDKLPEGYNGILSRPLFYCDLDDSLHLSRSDASYHWHKCNIDKIWRNLCEAQKEVKVQCVKIQRMKTKTLPQYQKTINGIKSRLRELLSNKDWKTTHSTHAAKKREILELRYRLMFVVGELKKQILKFDCVRREYRQVKESIATLENKLEEAKQKAKEAEEYWREHEEQDKV